ncbi:MAG: hypothetical protein SFU87_05075 [Chitinophagaceae bacterium]|nr:hypothetical protein [Chitinophagaceae bacterium]
MPTNSDAGKKITAEEANEYLKKYLEIRENLRKEEAIPIVNAKKINKKQKEELNKFHQSEVNAFIFSKGIVERFFLGKDEEGKDQPKADYLMVILSAKYTNDESGTPTVVIAGVNKADDGKTYNSLSIPYAADQQPPSASLVKFPPPKEGFQPVVLHITL